MDGHKANEKISAFLAKWKVRDVPVVKKVIISVVGFTVLLLGIAMIVLPGPAILIIPAGLTILASEYSWAKRLLRKAKNLGKKIVQKNGK